MKTHAFGLRISHGIGLAFFCLLAAAARGAESDLVWEGFAEPYRTINVAADETGTIQEVLVREGQIVAQGQPLVRLNSDVHEALLAVAQQNMQAQGRLDAANVEVRMRRERLEKLQSLRVEGHARQEEVDRALSELAIAEARLRTAEEDTETRRLEYEKIRAQVAERRTVRAPITGVVTTLHKDVGEFVAPNSPAVLTLVQVDTLLINFTLMSSDTSKLRVDQSVTVRFLASETEETGIVDFVSPVTDAESGTVLVKIRVGNRDGRFRSGERCQIHVGA